MHSAEEALMAWSILKIQRERRPLGSKLHPRAVPQNQEFLLVNVKRFHFEREAFSIVVFLVAMMSLNSLKKGFISRLARTVETEGDGNHREMRLVPSKELEKCWPHYSSQPWSLSLQ